MGDPHEHGTAPTELSAGRSNEGGLIRWPGRYDLLLSVVLAGRGHRLRSHLGDLLRLRPDAQVLDVGCGTGTLALTLASRVPAGAVHGVDPSPQMIAAATTKATKERLPATFSVASAQALPFPDQSFDGAVSTLALHHIPEQDRLPAVQEMLRVLRPGSPLVIADFQTPSNPVARGVAGHLLGHAMTHSDLADVGDLLTAAGATDIRRAATPVSWLGVITAGAPQLTQLDEPEQV